MRIEKPSDLTNYNPMRKNQNVIMNDLTQMLRDYNNKLRPLQLLVVIFSEGDQTYSIIKTIGELHLGIATQGIAGKNLFKANDQYVSNVLLKVNTKLGGRNFTLSQNAKM